MSSGVSLRIVCFLFMCNFAHLILCLLLRDAVFQARSHVQFNAFLFNAWTFRIKSQRCPHIAIFRKLEVVRHNADDGVLLPIERYCSSNQARVATVSAQPQSVADNRNMITTRFAVLRNKYAP